MTIINKDAEWDFIANEIIYNKPEEVPYKGVDLLRREMLFCLRGLLVYYYRAASTRKKNILKIQYKSLKKSYIHFERTQNNHARQKR